MIKKYVMIIAVLLLILMFTSTSTASFLFSKGEIYERLPENSPLRNILDRFSQVISNNDIMSDDGDAGEHDDDPDDPKEGGLLPKIWDLVGEKTPDDGNEPVDDSEETSNTIDLPDGDNDGAIQDGAIDPNAKEGTVANEKTIDEGEWTVEKETPTVKLERFVEIVMERNEKFGGMLQRVVERIFAPGTTESDGTAENDDVVGVVVEGGSMGTPGENKADVVVLTDDG